MKRGNVSLSNPRSSPASDLCYLVAGYKSWNRRIFEDELSTLPGRWLYIDSKHDLTPQYVEELGPRYIFFLHWSWIVPSEILERAECVCFHMTDLPFGRGGSPLQNLIVRGLSHSKLTALRMTEELDSGPIYLKEELSLEGRAEEIYLRANDLAAKMILRMVEEEPEPQPQEGDVTVFQRRKPKDSKISDFGSLEKLFDFIRMLDAEGYPPAFIEHQGYRFEFHRASLDDGRITASVTIAPRRAD